MNLIKLEGGGFGRPNADNELPIDIHYQKLSAWLVIPAFLAATTELHLWDSTAWL